MRLHPPPSSGGRVVHPTSARPLDQTLSEARRWHDAPAELKLERSLRVQERESLQATGQAGMAGARVGGPRPPPPQIGKAGPLDLLEGSNQAARGEGGRPCRGALPPEGPSLR